MKKITHHCPTCFTLEGSWWELRKAIKEAKKQGHLVFTKQKVGKGTYQVVLSTKTYGVKGE